MEVAEKSESLPAQKGGSEGKQLPFPPFHRTIKFRLIAMVALILVFSMTGMILLTTALFKNNTETRIQEDNLNVNRMVGSRVELELENTIFRSESYLNRLGPYAEGFIESDSEHLLFIGLLEQRGKRIVWQKRVTNLALLKGKELARKNIEPILTPEVLLPPPGSAKKIRLRNLSPLIKIPILLITLPVDNQSELLSVVLFEPRQLMEDFRRNEIAETFLVDNQGAILIHPDEKYVLTAKSFSDLPIVDKINRTPIDNVQTRFNFEEDAYMGSARRIPAFDVAVVTIAAESKIFATANSLQRRNISIMLIFLSLGVGVALYLSVRMTEPIQKLAVAARAIERGGSPHQLPSIGKDEIGILTRSFLSMVTGLKEKQETIQYQAHHDSLTGLVNRSLLLERLRLELEHAERNKTWVAVFYLDLDRFKNINDTLGHSVGDQVLIEVARRLQDAFRKSDTVARQGGDEFLIALPDIYDFRTTDGHAEKILDLFSSPFVYRTYTLRLSCSLGIALYPESGTDAESLLKCADIAMYSAKKRSGNSYQYYSETLTQISESRLQMENELHQALMEEDFVLHYQPRINLMSGEVIGVEALLRWNRGGTLQDPLQFIPLAEEIGLILPLSDWAIKQAAQMIKKINTALGKKLKLAINFSPRHFELPDLVLHLDTILEDSSLSPSDFEIELTEGTILIDPRHTAEQLTRLKSSGYYIVVDDFGTGFSSAAYLKRFPVDALKIDHEFIASIPESQEAVSIVSAIIGLAGNLKLNTIAEGVENERQMGTLLDLGCREAMGYHICPPLDPDGLLQCLQGKKRTVHGGGPEQ